MTTSSTGPESPALLQTVPLHRLLVRVLRLCLPAERHDEFLGDLIEEAHLRSTTATRGQLAIWIWTQALRSLPTLLGMRLRGIGAWLVAPGQGAGRPGALFAVPYARVAHRGFTGAAAVSLSVHALVVAMALGWVFARVEELEEAPPVRAPLDLLAAFVSEPTPEIQTEMVGDEPTVAPVRVAEPRATVLSRRARPARRPLPLPGYLPATGAAPGPQLPGSAMTGVSASAPSAIAATASSAKKPAVSQLAVGQVGNGGSVALPPRIAEKRCLACPTPQLAPPYARMARGHDMLVRTCVNVSGEVTSVEILRGFDSTVDREVTATVRHWRLIPYLLDGHPVPFCYATRFVFASH